MTEQNLTHGRSQPYEDVAQAFLKILNRSACEGPLPQLQFWPEASGARERAQPRVPMTTGLPQWRRVPIKACRVAHFGRGGPGGKSGHWGGACPRVASPLPDLLLQAAVPARPVPSPT